MLDLDLQLPAQQFWHQAPQLRRFLQDSGVVVPELVTGRPSTVATMLTSDWCACGPVGCGTSWRMIDCTFESMCLLMCNVGLVPNTSSAARAGVR